MTKNSIRNSPKPEKEHFRGGMIVQEEVREETRDCAMTYPDLQNESFERLMWELDICNMCFTQKIDPSTLRIDTA